MAERRLDVTVVIGVYNAMPYLIKCVLSVLEQSIGLDRLEIVAVNDGSTDGSGEQLDRFAAAYPAVRVIHQPNSGGPAGPRNVGVEHATGRYVFFLDADDYLGVEALARMVAIADENHTDVVLGRMVGVPDRPVPKSMYRRNQATADLFTSRVYWNLRSQKLFRRSLIMRAGLRFPDLPLGEDQAFAALAYLHADGISVVGDYDCYYLRRRDDGGNLTTALNDIRTRMAYTEYMMALVAEQVEAGARRDVLLRRHFGQELAKKCLFGSFLASDRAARQEAVLRARQLIAAHYHPGIAATLRAAIRLSLHLVSHGTPEQLATMIQSETSEGRGRDFVDKGRVFAAYPFFRDPAVGVPDSCFEVTGELRARHHLARVRWQGATLRLTGHAYIDHVDTVEPDTRLVLRERTTGVEHSWSGTAAASPGLDPESGYDYGLAGFQFDLDLSRGDGSGPLPAGLWDAYLRVRAQGVEKEVRLGRRRAASIDTSAQTRILPVPGAPGVVTTAYFTSPYGHLTLDMHEAKYRFAPDLRVDRIEWVPSGPPVLLVTGQVELGPAGALPNPRPAVVLAFGDTTHRVTGGRLDGAGTQSFTVAVPLLKAAAGRPLPYGKWRMDLELAVAGRRYRQVIVVKPPPARRFWRSGRPAVAQVARDNSGVLTLRPIPARVVIGKALRRIAPRGHRPR